MEQIIKMAQSVYERRIKKDQEIAETEKAEEERIKQEAKELAKLVIRLFGTSNKEKGDYRIKNVMLQKSKENSNILCMVAFEKDKHDAEPYKGYSELINLQYISKAIDRINHQVYDAKVLYKAMGIIFGISNYYISSWSTGEYEENSECAEVVIFGM